MRVLRYEYHVSAWLGGPTTGIVPRIPRKHKGTFAGFAARRSRSKQSRPVLGSGFSLPPSILVARGEHRRPAGLRTFRPHPNQSPKRQRADPQAVSAPHGEGPALNASAARTIRNPIRAQRPSEEYSPAAEIYGRPAWDKILKSDTIQVRFKTSVPPMRLRPGRELAGASKVPSARV